METLVAESPEPLGYSISGTCRVMPCSRSFLYRELKAGRIRATYHGKKVLISRQEILRFLGEDSTQVEASK